MAFENLLVEKREGIAFITFNRPKVLNALNRKTVEELRDALMDARDDASVRVLILTGAGEKSFVAGADIGELAQQNAGRWEGFFVVWAGRVSFAGDAGEAVDLRDQWICAGRRMRTGAVVLDSDCEQEREVGAA